jgi:hypothetical protein
MADTKISALCSLATCCVCAASDVLAIVDSSCPITTKKITVSALKGTDKVTGTQEIWIPAGAWSVDTACAGADVSTSKISDKYINSINFDTTCSEDAQFLWHPPLNWDYSTIRFQLIWTNACGAACQTIDFDLAGVALTDDDAIGSATFGTAANVTDTFTAQNDINKTCLSSAITIGGTPTSGDSILLKLSRDTAADNLAGDCKVIGVNLRISITKGTAT